MFMPSLLARSCFWVNGSLTLKITWYIPRAKLLTHSKKTMVQLFRPFWYNWNYSFSRLSKYWCIFLFQNSNICRRSCRTLKRGFGKNHTCSRSRILKVRFSGKSQVLEMPPPPPPEKWYSMSKVPSIYTQNNPEVQIFICFGHIPLASLEIIGT